MDWVKMSDEMLAFLRERIGDRDASHGPPMTEDSLRREFEQLATQEVKPLEATQTGLRRPVDPKPRT
jgi:hypothetical protein